MRVRLNNVTLSLHLDISTFFTETVTRYYLTDIGRTFTLMKQGNCVGAYMYIN